MLNKMQKAQAVVGKIIEKEIGDAIYFTSPRLNNDNKLETYTVYISKWLGRTDKEKVFEESARQSNIFHKTTNKIADALPGTGYESRMKCFIDEDEQNGYTIRTELHITKI